MENLPEDIKNIIGDFIIFRPNTKEELKTALLDWFNHNEEAIRKYGDISEWNTDKIVNKCDKKFMLTYFGFISAMSITNTIFIDFNDKCVIKNKRIEELIKNKEYKVIILQSSNEVFESIQDECYSIKQFEQLDNLINKLSDICRKSENFFEKKNLKIVILGDL
tara:strand:+ start:357 stop:848 length:492 start_codon:yes stop_codon:yes gene_type:complete